MQQTSIIHTHTKKRSYVIEIPQDTAFYPEQNVLESPETNRMKLNKENLNHYHDQMASFD
jgi:hypothetical protein